MSISPGKSPGIDLESLVQDLVESKGYEYVGLEWLGGHQSSLCIYVDKPGGIGCDELAVVSRHLGTLLDAEAGLTGSYYLEVSSPGVDRPLFRPQHYAQAQGKMVVLELKTPHLDKRRWQGRIVQTDDLGVHLEVEQTSVFVSWVQIKKAHLQFMEK